MDMLQALVFGLIQGATEYLPVSSSAHLAVAPWLFGWPAPSFAFDILVQLGTLVAVIFYLRADLRQIFASSLRGLWQRKLLIDDHARRGWMIIVATLPAVFFGLVFKKQIEASFGDVNAVLWQLIATGVLLLVAELLARKQGSAGKPLTFGLALLIGFGQALAIIPGISRSGSTIAMAMVLGVKRDEATRFSFLMSIPVMLGAGVLGARDLLKQPDVLAREGAGIAVSFLVAMLTGFVVIRWFLGFVRSRSLLPFGVYCVIAGAVGLLLR